MEEKLAAQRNAYRMLEKITVQSISMVLDMFRTACKARAFDASAHPTELRCDLSIRKNSVHAPRI